MRPGLGRAEAKAGTGRVHWRTEWGGEMRDSQEGIGFFSHRTGPPPPPAGQQCPCAPQTLPREAGWQVLTMRMMSGYTGSMRTPRVLPTHSTSSLSAARFTSFPFRSATQSKKSNTTPHWASFLLSSSCSSEAGTSGKEGGAEPGLQLPQLWGGANPPFLEAASPAPRPPALVPSHPFREPMAPVPTPSLRGKGTSLPPDHRGYGGLRRKQVTDPECWGSQGAPNSHSPSHRWHSVLTAGSGVKGQSPPSQPGPVAQR